MPIGKNEKRLLFFLGFLLYVFAFYKFVWVPVVPAIREVNVKISSTAAEKARLDNDLANIEARKSEIEAKKNSKERIEEYLMSSANLVDSLEYINKLCQFLENGITELYISRPEEKFIVSSGRGLKNGTDNTTLSSNGGSYYEIRVDFKANMPYQRALELVKFLEGGTRKAKISKFVVKPLKDDNSLATQGQTAQQVQQAAQADQKYEINMSVCLYSLNLRASDRMYEYSRHKLGSFVEGGGIFISSDSTTSPETNTAYQSQDILAQQAENADILIKGMSFLTGGENLQVFGTNRSSEVLRLSSNKLTNLSINFISSTYTVSTYDAGDNLVSIKGQLSPGDIKVHVDIDMPNIKENENIRYNIKISNNTDRKVLISINDKQKRARILDRYGNEIRGNSTREKVNIL